MRRVLIVIPACNEADTIELVVSKSLKYGDVLVINDGSVDQTYSLANKAGANVINLNENKGYDHALNLGFNFAKDNQYSIMITIDGDGQLPISKIPYFIKEIDRGSDLVVGSRQTLFRVTELVLSFFANISFSIQDPYCGMKAYNLETCDQKNFGNYKSIGTDLCFSLVFGGRKFKNISIQTKSRKDQSRFGGAIASEIRMLPSMLIGLARISWNIILKIF